MALFGLTNKTIVYSLKPGIPHIIDGHFQLEWRSGVPIKKDVEIPKGDKIYKILDYTVLHIEKHGQLDVYTLSGTFEEYRMPHTNEEAVYRLKNREELS